MENKKKYIELKIARTVTALNDNGMVGYHIRSNDHLFKVLADLVDDGATVAHGGAMSLHELGVFDWLRTRNINFLDRYKKGISDAKVGNIRRQGLLSDIYFTSSNAVTETGHLFNVDGIGNRVAAMIYGPKKVIVIVGANKIVADDAAAVERARRVAIPLNNIRMNRGTPCIDSGYCDDGCSDKCVASSFVFLKNQMIRKRIHVLILEGDYGY